MMLPCSSDNIVSPIEMKEKDNEITGTLNNTQDEFVLRYPGESEADLTETIRAANVDVDVVNENPSLLAWFLGNVFPYLLLFGLFIFLMYQLQGGGNKVMQFGKSKAKLVTKDQPKVTFDDVVGKAAVLGINTEKGTRFFHGVVSRFELRDQAPGETFFRAELG